MLLVPSSAAPLAFDHPGNDAARLAGLLDSAMDAIISVDASQQVVLYNRAAETVFGWRAAEVLGQPLNKLIPERFRARHGHDMQRFGTTGATSRHMGSSAVIYGLRADGKEFPLEASISQLCTPEGTLFTVILRDVTAKMQAQQENARLLARLSGLLESAMDAIITIDASEVIIMYNQAAEQIFGWPAEQAIGEQLEKLIPLRFRPGHARILEQFISTGATARQIGNGMVLHGLRANGSEFPMEASISQLDTAEGKLLTVILRDITEKARAQEELSTFATEAHKTLENEKRRIARELHDELAQSLTALKMDAIWARDSLPAAEQAVCQKLADMLVMLDATVAATRRIAADLRPLMLDDLGLVPAVEWLIQGFTQRSGVKCSLAIDEDMELDEPHATAVFRILQEALANITKHAAATHVKVDIERTTDAVALLVTDNGQGFSPAAPRKADSLGLTGLREHVRLLKGTIAIDSEPGNGARIAVRLPIVESGAPA